MVYNTMTKVVSAKILLTSSATVLITKIMNEDKLMPIHPGEVLLEEFIKPMNLSQNQIALALGVPEQCINEIVHGKRCITADIALRLARYFDMSPRFWLGLQMDYDLDVVEDEIGDQLDKEVAVMTVICAEK